MGLESESVSIPGSANVNGLKWEAGIMTQLLVYLGTYGHHFNGKDVKN